ncbi:hypothetical protein ACT8ZV_18030 [Nocardioides sp. MAHUQ-72]|uniref:hypothetical protein n=1 Tax=unclassified Nocardioides TaxID=2615069 RepID=UPI00361CF723
MTTGPSPSHQAARPALRLAARLLLAGQLLFILVTQFHTGGDANDHHSIFAAYAHSGDWKGVHALQFAAVAVLVAGLLVLASALEISARRPIWAGRVGAALAVVSLGLYGVLQAVDGIGNKQVDRAWLTASDADKSARFASAEAMRWLEWGMSSYHAYAMGLALVALAAALAAVRTSAPRVVAGLVALSGLTYVAEGWVAGTGGFNAAHSVLIVASWILSLTWMIWLVAITGRASGTHGGDA